jgi:hypothetical protein
MNWYIFTQICDKTATVIVWRSGATVQKSVAQNLCTLGLESAWPSTPPGWRQNIFPLWQHSRGRLPNVRYFAKSSSSPLRLTRAQSAINYIFVKLSALNFTIRNEGRTANVTIFYPDLTAEYVSSKCNDVAIHVCKCSLSPSQLLYRIQHRQWHARISFKIRAAMKSFSLLHISRQSRRNSSNHFHRYIYTQYTQIHIHTYTQIHIHTIHIDTYTHIHIDTYTHNTHRYI